MRSLLLMCIGAWTMVTAWQHTPQSQLFVNALCAAARDLGIRPKEVAYLQGLTEAEWSKQCAGTDRRHVSLQRISRLPASVLKEWITRVAPAFGLRCFDRHDDIVLLIDAVKQAVNCGAETERTRA